MKSKNKILKRYAILLLAIIFLIILYFVNREIAKIAIKNSLLQFKTMLLVIPAIFILLGLIDAWVPRATMIKYMGEGSGLKGILLAFLLGSCAAGPLYGAFPMAAVLLKKGAKFRNIMIFIGAWSTTKIPMFLFEATSLGWKFAILRFALDLIAIPLIALALDKSTSKEHINNIYKNAENNL